MACLDTSLDAHGLLAALQAIEHAHGRERPYHNAPRTLDLDLLLFGDDVVASDTLSVPHPRMHERAFVITPLLEIAPDVIIPGHGPARNFAALVAGQAIARLAWSTDKP